MGKTKNISPISYQNYLNELIIANQKKILAQLDRMERQQAERFDRIEAYINLPAEEKKIQNDLINARQAYTIYRVHRNTLLDLRKKKLLPEIKPGKEYLYHKADIEKISRSKIL